MKKQSLYLTCFLISAVTGLTPIGDTGSFFYQELGCKKAESGKFGYNCPDFTPDNKTCKFADKILKLGEKVDTKELVGSCIAQCSCTYDGKIDCAEEECLYDEDLKLGCSYFRNSSHSCCPVGTICGPLKVCKVDGEIHKEGDIFDLKNSCDVCICEKHFKKEAPFCKRMRCLDQAYFGHIISGYGAPVFLKSDKCCPSIWIQDEGEQITNIGKSIPGSEEFCKFGKRKLKLGEGFEKTFSLFATSIQLKCECSIPPFVICNEKLHN